MKRLILVIVIAVFGVAAFAQAKPGQFGIQGGFILTGLTNITSGTDLGCKVWVTDAMALRASLGLLSQSTAGTTTTGFTLGAGLEYHFAGKGSVSPYVGAEVGYSGVSVSTGASTPSDVAVDAVFGGEYFLTSNFSWGGQLMLGVESYSPAVGSSTSYLYTAFATSLTWYLN